MAEATLTKDTDVITQTTPAAGYASGQVIQIADGRAAFVTGLNARTSGDQAGLKTSGQVTLAKGTSLVILKGAPLYWDRSANTLTPLKAVTGADFFVGVALADAIAAATTVGVDLNVQPRYVIDLLRDPADSVAVGAAALTVHPGFLKFLMDNTSEAQKIDAMSMSSVPVTIPFILEGRMAIYTVGSGAAVDMNIGLANATHATDADSITESVFLHFDNALDIKVESDDGPTEVAATDSTVDAVDDVYFDFAFDCRNLADIQVYIDAVNVLPASVFKLNAATGPIKILAHQEKTSGTTVGEFRISKLAIRATDLAS